MLTTETISFADAAAMVEACRSELERSGFLTQASALKGLEVFDETGVEVAFLTIHNLPAANEQADNMKRYTLEALEKALYRSRMAS